MRVNVQVAEQRQKLVRAETSLEEVKKDLQQMQIEASKDSSVIPPGVQEEIDQLKLQLRIATSTSDVREILEGVISVVGDRQYTDRTYIPRESPDESPLFLPRVVSTNPSMLLESHIRTCFGVPPRSCPGICACIHTHAYIEGRAGGVTQLL